jgi:hypothetical protein
MSEGEACNTASGHPQRNVYGAREGHGLARQLVPREPRDTHGYNGCLGKAHGALDSEVRSEKSTSVECPAWRKKTVYLELFLACLAGLLRVWQPGPCQKVKGAEQVNTRRWSSPG